MTYQGHVTMKVVESGVKFIVIPHPKAPALPRTPLWKRWRGRPKEKDEKRPISRGKRKAEELAEIRDCLDKEFMVIEGKGLI